MNVEQLSYLERRAERCTMRVLQGHLLSMASTLLPPGSGVVQSAIVDMADELVHELYPKGSTGKQYDTVADEVHRQWSSCANTIVQRITRQYRHARPIPR